MTKPLALIAVIGPVEPPLLRAWCGHYRSLGVRRFVVALHAPEVSERLDTLAEVLHTQTGHHPTLIAHGPWHEHTNQELRDRLRGLAGAGWHLLADADEFQQHPGGLDTSLQLAHRTGGAVAGLLLDRVAASGRFLPWDASLGLDRTYPLGGLLTHELLGGDPRKIVLADSSIQLASGNHRAPGHRPDPGHVVAVHHFKWRSGVLADLRRRVERFGSGTWAELSPAVRWEAQRLLGHVEAHAGRLDVAGGPVEFRPVTLEELPVWWPATARRVMRDWRPPRPDRYRCTSSSSPSPEGGSNR